MKVRSKALVAAALVVAVLLQGGSATARPQARLYALRGVVKDQQGGLIVGARVSLANQVGVNFETTTDAQGEFHFDRLSSGMYVLKVGFGGFGDHQQRIELGGQSGPARIEVQLLPTISETVLLDLEKALAPLDPEQASGMKTLTERELQALPDDPDQLRERLQQLATSAGSAPGEATVTVDGFLSGGRLPAKASIREVRINPNLFSAEYDRAPFRGGRIEILTKPGASSFGGSAFLNFNPSALNAREAFARVRAASKTRRYGGQFGGPIARKRAGFFLDFESRDIDETATVNTVVLNDARQPVSFSTSVPAPTQLLIGSGRVDWQATQAHTLVFRYEGSRNRLDNQGVGGFNLPERALNHIITEHSFRFTETAIINSSTANELRVGLTFERLSQKAVSGAQAISVPGAFESGGAATQEVTREARRLEITDYLSTTVGKHSLKFGVQLFHRRFEDRRFENPNGTFVFGGGLFPELGPDGQVVISPGGPSLINISGLEQYRRTLLGLPGGVPTRFFITLGSSDVTVRQWLLAGFLQDEWRPRENLSVSLGLRYEGQTRPSDGMSLAPRLGIAYTPDKRQRWVLRARAGIFYDRISDALTFEARRLDGSQLSQIIIDSPSFPDPLAGGTAAFAIPTFRRLDESLRPPASLQMRVEVARELPGGWRLDVNHSWTRGWSTLRSRNVNAPFVGPGANPFTAPRPLGVAENILQFEPSGRIRGRVLYVGVNQSANQYFNVFAGYLHFSFRTDADTPFSLPQSSYDFSGEWAPPFWQARHRFFLTNIINLPRKLRLSTSVTAASGTPFNITTGRDNNGDGNFNDRPSVADPSDPRAIATPFGVFDPDVVNGSLRRNAGTNPAIVTVDLNLSRQFRFGPKVTPTDKRYMLMLNARASNLFNHTNVLGLNGVVTSPFFGRANAASPARRIEFGVRLNF